MSQSPCILNWKRNAVIRIFVFTQTFIVSYSIYLFYLRNFFQLKVECNTEPCALVKGKGGRETRSSVTRELRSDTFWNIINNRNTIFKTFGAIWFRENSTKFLRKELYIIKAKTGLHKMVQHHNKKLKLCSGPSGKDIFICFITFWKKKFFLSSFC